MGVIRLNGLDSVIDRHEYPVNPTDFAQRHGDEVIELQNDRKTVTQILARLDDETYTRPRDVRGALLTGVGHEAIGRRYCNDHDPSPLGGNGPEMISF